MTSDVSIAFADSPNAIHDNGAVRRRVVLLIDGAQTDVASTNLDRVQTRDRLAKRWAKSFGLDRSILDEKLRKAAVIATSEGQDAADTTTNLKADDEGPRRTQADKLVELVEDAELFHAAGEDGEAYITITVGEHKETHAVNRRRFRRWLAGRFWQEHGKAPGGQAIQDAIAVIASRGIFEGPEFSVAVRVAEHDGNQYLDLGDEDWKAVRIGGDGWEIVAEPPVKFTRPRGMSALPTPVTGGNVTELRRFLNTPDDNTWVLTMSWMVAAFRAVGPYPLLVLQGEQGSAKTTTCRLLRSLIDPNQMPMRSEPRDCRDLMIAASNSWALAFDNLSKLSPMLSDGLCRLATGGGFATRELFTDGDEKLFSATRPVLVNGIDELATRGDLLDRAIVVTLPPIPTTQRRTEASLWREFEEARPRILGALLDAVCHAIRTLPTVQLMCKPRMADFAEWATAAEGALGFGAGRFLHAYEANRSTANESAIEASSIGSAVVALANDRCVWEGTASTLLALLEADTYSDEATRKRKTWPRTGRGVSSALRRIAPNLRAAGMEVTFTRDSDVRRRRIIRIEQSAAQPSEPSESSTIVADDHQDGDSGWTHEHLATVQGRPQPSNETGDPRPETHSLDGSDVPDGPAPAESRMADTTNTPDVWRVEAT